MNSQLWQHAYALWKEDRKNACTTPGSGYEFLAMHRFLIQSMRTLWPSLEDQFEGWRKFPKNEDDYPPPLFNQFKAWPDEVIKSGLLIDRLMKMNNEELLAHWENENAFGHWLECGTAENGMEINGLYGALIHNGQSNIPHKNIGITEYRLNTYLFWKIHGWIDRSWNKYRKRLNKTPYDTDLQAELLNQCQTLLDYAEQAKKSAQKKASTSINQPFINSPFTNGELNPNYSFKAVELLGEIVAIETTPSGKILYQLDLKRKGVKRIWATGLTHFNSNKLRIGKRFVFIGRIISIDEYADAKTIQSSLSSLSSLSSNSILEAESIQTPK